MSKPVRFFKRRRKTELASSTKLNLTGLRLEFTKLNNTKKRGFWVGVFRFYSRTIFLCLRMSTGSNFSGIAYWGSPSASWKCPEESVLSVTVLCLVVGILLVMLNSLVVVFQADSSTSSEWQNPNIKYYFNQLITAERSSSCKYRCIGALPKANQHFI